MTTIDRHRAVAAGIVVFIGLMLSLPANADPGGRGLAQGNSLRAGGIPVCEAIRVGLAVRLGLTELAFEDRLLALESAEARLAGLCAFTAIVLNTNSSQTGGAPASTLVANQISGGNDGQFEPGLSSLVKCVRAAGCKDVACVAQSCPSELASCSGQQIASGLSCVGIIECTSRCRDDAACQATCFSEGTPAAQQALNGLAQCIQLSCGSADAGSLATCVELHCSAEASVCRGGLGGT